MLNDFYVYAWRRPDTDDVFYVGKGRGRRDVAFKRANPIFMNVIGKLDELGLKPSVVKLHQGLTESQALALEVQEIANYGRRDIGTGTLTNLTNGGEGASGWVPTAETKQRQRAAALGKKKSDSHRENVANARRGVPLSAETKRKISASGRGKVRAPDARAHMSQSFRRSGIRVTNTSGFRGVSFHKATQRWMARISEPGKRRHIGYFDSPEAAARARDAVAKAIWGDGAFLNFPDELAA